LRFCASFCFVRFVLAWLFVLARVFVLTRVFVLEATGRLGAGRVIVQLSFSSLPVPPALAVAGRIEQTRLLVPEIGVQLSPPLVGKVEVEVDVDVVDAVVSVTGLPEIQVIGPFAVMIGALIGVVVVVVVITYTT
jgi:hypothetical protein